MHVQYITSSFDMFKREWHLFSPLRHFYSLYMNFTSLISHKSEIISSETYFFTNFLIDKSMHHLNLVVYILIPSFSEEKVLL